MNVFKSVLVAASSILCFVTAPVSAATVVDTGTPASGIGHFLNQTGPSTGQQLAAQFTLDEDYILNSIETYIKPTYPGSGGALRYEILSDAGGLPGTTLFGQTFDVIPSNPLTYQWEGLSGLSLALDAGTYWLALLPEIGGFNGSALSNAPDPLASYAFQNPANSGWRNQALGFGVRINAELPDDMSDVPLPASLPLLLVGFGGLALMRRRGL